MFNSPNKSVGVIKGAPPQGKNLIINGNLTVDQRGVYTEYVADRWKIVDANNMTQIIEDKNFEPSTEYTLSWEGGTPQQITSPASGHWTLPNIPRTARKIQLEKGDEATDFEWEDYGTTLAKCQRYYYKEEKPYRMYGYKRHDNFMYFDAYSPVPLRGVPTIQKLNNGYLANYQNTFTGVQTGFLARAFTGSRFTIECSTTYTGTHEIVPVWQDSILTFDSEL